MKVKFTLNMSNLVVSENQSAVEEKHIIESLSDGSRTCLRKRYCLCPVSGLRIRTF